MATPQEHIRIFCADDYRKPFARTAAMGRGVGNCGAIVGKLWENCGGDCGDFVVVIVGKLWW